MLRSSKHNFQIQIFMKKQTIVWGIIAIAALVAISYLFYSVGYNNAPSYKNENEVLKKQQEQLQKQISQKDRQIDSIELDYSRLYVSKEILEKRVKALEKQKAGKIIDYRRKKPDERAMDFLIATQQNKPIGLPVFSGDSLLVPIGNIDSAMAIIIEEQFCDTVIMVKDSLIENAENRITYLYQIIDLERGKFEDLKMVNELLGLRNEESAKMLEATKKKLKWVKFKSTVKDVVIVGGILYVLLK